MKEQEIKQFFFRFLKQKNIFMFFVKGITESKGVSFYSAMWKFEIEIRQYPRNIIDACLWWSKTKEGADFWNGVDKEWRKLYKSKFE